MKTPPRYIIRFLRWFCKEGSVEEVEGDLTELYQQESLQSVRMAKLRLLWRVIKYLRPEFVKSIPGIRLDNPFQMFLHHNRMARRSMLRNKVFSIVTITGLALGIGSALVIFLWANDEMKVDHFHSRIDRMYRVMENQTYSDGRIFTFNTTPGTLAPFVKDRYPEVERASRLTWQMNQLFSADDKSFYQDGRYADQDFLQIFSFDLKKGDIRTALKNKNSIVISQPMAETFFGQEDPLGKVIQLNHQSSFTVSGVLESIPANSSLRFDYLLPFEFFYDENKQWLDLWFNNSIRTYILLHPQSDPLAFDAKLRPEISHHMEKSNVELFVQPFGDAYLYGDFENGQQAGGRIDYVHTFSLIAAAVLFIACINYINLATAQSARRAKEVGLRKVIGAYPGQLFAQFMGESFLTVILSGGVAIGWVMLLLPALNDFTGKQLELSLLNKEFFVVFAVVLFLTVIFSGGYPALFISRYKPSAVLKGQLQSGTTAMLLRRSLVVIQFSLSIILIISTTIVFRQMTFMEKKDTGYSRDNLFYAWMQGDIPSKWEVVRNRLLAEPGIDAVTSSGQLPIEIDNSDYDVYWEGKNPDNKILFNILEVDYDFVQTMKMRMAEGRAFDRTIPNEKTNYLINEKAASAMNLKGSPVGEEVTLWGRKGKIVGVVKDFNFGSLHHAVDPIILKLPQSDNGVGFGTMIIRAKANEAEQALQSTTKIWNEFGTGYPFKYAFLDQDWQDLYRVEGQRGKIFNGMAVLSVFISCLGLFGLSAFSAERRRKELGVRKILGASVSSLVTLMGKEFTVLVLIATAVGCPLGWYLMNAWLAQYAYHIEVGWGTLLLASVACLIISFLTVAYHSIRSSLSDPVKVLKYE